MDIYKEMWKIAEQIESLKNVGYYPNVDMLIQGLNHQLSQLHFFYNKLVPSNGGDASKTYFTFMNAPIPKEHQLVYVNLSRGYPKEIFDPHYCYVLKILGTQFIVLPVTSMKPATVVNEDFEMQIEESDGTLGLLNFDQIKSIDSMRIIQEKPYIEVKTSRESIIEKFTLLMPQISVDK